MISRLMLGFRLAAIGGPLFATLLPAVFPSPVLAGELMPFETPEEPIPWEELKFEDIQEPVGQSSESTIEPKPVDNRPDWQPPPLDAYFDLSFGNADFDALGYPDTEGGYRFVVGFELTGLLSERLHLAPEVAYTRIGRAEYAEVFSEFNAATQNTTVTTSNYILDLSALDFGARLGLDVLPRVSAYTRAGMQVYHTAEKLLRTKELRRPQQDTQISTERPSSTSDANANLYAALGMAIRLGKVPSIYGEISTRRIHQQSVETLSAGVLLNF